ncbi:MAG: hemerythrin domain-containing protein, partial [Bdellovibrionota bacterium]
MVKQSLQRLRFLARTVMRTERDALDWLEADHIKVETLFFLARIIPNRRRRAEIFQRIRSELLQHGALEKKVFYPACSRIPELRSLVEESLLEHGQIENLLGEIVTLGNAEHAQARIRVLMEEVEHHVNL